jgi:regulator of sigma E protease
MDIPLDLIPDGLRTPLAFIVVLGVLIFIHELGHYLAARWRGVHVERFSVGFGRAITSWTDKRGTEWRIGWLPLGGYVKLHGQEQPGDATEETRAAWLPGRTFHDKPVLDRAIVVAAGPIANFLLAAVLFAGLFMVHGRPVNQGLAMIGQVSEGSAAAAAGLLPGDRVVALDDVAVTRFEQIQRHVQPRAGQPVQVRIERDGVARSVAVTPTVRPADGLGVLGISGGPAVFERLDPASALLAGVTYTGDISAQTLGGLWQMISGARGTEELGGPLRIAQLSGQVAEMGLVPLISFIAILSVNLALINLFPIPVLDGGHLMFYAAEAIRGRPVPPRAQEMGFRAGFALLVALFVFSTWNDLTQLGLFRWVARLVG